MEGAPVHFVIERRGSRERVSHKPAATPGIKGLKKREFTGE
jgi:hypothetical protein